MKLIPLTKGKHAIVDDEDYDRVSSYKWCARPDGYACRGVWIGGKHGKYKQIRMHRFIIGEIPKGSEVDHINGDRLDNRKSNLRAATRCQNQANKGIQPSNSTGFKGVSLHKQSNKFRAQVGKDGKRIHLGVFNTPEEAHAAYCEAASELHGEFARTE